ncbi:hypothetical protein DFH29DRAFT_997598 [Suillus ampliporus]|nr:hypothetical protein DFH29DRAFT_997598 [Suillus ampliporus]
MSDPYDKQHFARVAYHMWVNRICQLCPCIIFAYDYLLTLDREVEFIWKRPMSLPNILYIIVRYGGGALIILTTGTFMSENTSRKLYITGFVIASAIHSYLNTKTIPLAVHTSYHFKGGPAFASFGQFSSYCSSEYTNEPLPGIRICAVVHVPPTVAYVWLPDIIFAAFLFLLAARVGLKRGRFDFNIFRMERKDLIDALVYGNVHYFFCIFVANAVNAGIWIALGFSWYEVPEGFAAVAEVILGCRMVLDLKSAASDSEGLHVLDSLPTQRVY